MAASSIPWADDPSTRFDYEELASDAAGGVPGASEAELQAEITELQEEIERLRQLVIRLHGGQGVSEAEILQLQDDVSKLDDRMTAVEGKVSSLETTINNANLATISQRFSNIESRLQAEEARPRLFVGDSTVVPSNPTSKDLWVNTSVDDGQALYWSGNGWVAGPRQPRVWPTLISVNKSVNDGQAIAITNLEQADAAVNTAAGRLAARVTAAEGQQTLNTNELNAIRAALNTHTGDQTVHRNVYLWEEGTPPIPAVPDPGDFRVVTKTPVGGDPNAIRLEYYVDARWAIVRNFKTLDAQAATGGQASTDLAALTERVEDLEDRPTWSFTRQQPDDPVDRQLWFRPNTAGTGYARMAYWDAGEGFWITILEPDTLAALSTTMASLSTQVTTLSHGVQNISGEISRLQSITVSNTEPSNPVPGDIWIAPAGNRFWWYHTDKWDPIGSFDDLIVEQSKMSLEMGTLDAALKDLLARWTAGLPVKVRTSGTARPVGPVTGQLDFYQVGAGTDEVGVAWHDGSQWVESGLNGLRAKLSQRVIEWDDEPNNEVLGGLPLVRGDVWISRSLGSINVWRDDKWNELGSFNTISGQIANLTKAVAGIGPGTGTGGGVRLGINSFIIRANESLDSVVGQQNDDVLFVLSETGNFVQMKRWSTATDPASWVDIWSAPNLDQLGAGLAALRTIYLGGGFPSDSKDGDILFQTDDLGALVAIWRQDRSGDAVSPEIIFSPTALDKKISDSQTSITAVTAKADGNETRLGEHSGAILELTTTSSQNRVNIEDLQNRTGKLETTSAALVARGGVIVTYRDSDGNIPSGAVGVPTNNDIHLDLANDGTLIRILVWDQPDPDDPLSGKGWTDFFDWEAFLKTQTVQDEATKRNTDNIAAVASVNAQQATAIGVADTRSTQNAEQIARNTASAATALKAANDQTSAIAAIQATVDEVEGHARIFSVREGATKPSGDDDDAPAIGDWLFVRDVSNEVSSVEYWTGAVWVVSPYAAGQKGDKGAKGDKGDTGAVGPAGPEGPAGAGVVESAGSGRLWVPVVPGSILQDDRTIDAITFLTDGTLVAAVTGGLWFYNQLISEWWQRGTTFDGFASVSGLTLQKGNLLSVAPDSRLVYYWPAPTTAGTTNQPSEARLGQPELPSNVSSLVAMTSSQDGTIYVMSKNGAIRYWNHPFLSWNVITQADLSPHFVGIWPGLAIDDDGALILLAKFGTSDKWSLRRLEEPKESTSHWEPYGADLPVADTVTSVGLSFHDGVLYAAMGDYVYAWLAVGASSSTTVDLKPINDKITALENRQLVTVSVDPPPTPVNDDIWIDSVTRRVSVWDTTTNKWEPSSFGWITGPWTAVQAEHAKGRIYPNDLWIDEQEKRFYIYTGPGTTIDDWEELGGGAELRGRIQVFGGSTTPQNPKDNDIWVTEWSGRIQVFDEPDPPTDTSPGTPGTWITEVPGHWVSPLDPAIVPIQKDLLVDRDLWTDETTKTTKLRENGAWVALSEVDLSTLTQTVNSMNSRIDSVDSKVAVIDSDVGDLDTEVTKLANEVATSVTKTLDDRLTTAETDIADLETRTGDLDTASTSTQSRLTVLEGQPQYYVSTKRPFSTNPGDMWYELNPGETDIINIWWYNGNQWLTVLDKAVTSDIEVRSTAPANPATNDIYVDSTLSALRRWTGTIWVNVGIQGMTYQGGWVAAKDYQIQDVVYYQGSGFVCTRAHTSGIGSRPDTRVVVGAYWSLFARGT